MPKPSRSESLLRRIKNKRRKRESQILGEWISENLIVDGAFLFVVSGSTTYWIAEQTLKEKDSVHINTNSIPVAWRAMELEEAGKLAPGASVRVLEGVVREVTGAIAFNQAPKDKNDSILLYSPHGLTKTALVGNRDVEHIQVLLKAHKRVIMPISWEKLITNGSEKIKSYGHWKKVKCDLVLTDKPIPDLKFSTADKKEATQNLNQIKKKMGNRLVIRRVPI